MILVIEDFEPQRYVRTRHLEAAGFAVRAVAGVATARSALASESFQAVVSDVGLGDGNGISLCAEIKRDRPALPVVLVSATYRTHDARSDAIAAGADAFLTEPVPPEQLVRVVRQLIEEGNQKARGKPSTRPSS